MLARGAKKGTRDQDGGEKDLPDSPVTTSSSSSRSTHSVALLTLSIICVASARSSAVMSAPAYRPDAPSPTSAGVLGITRTMCGADAAAAPSTVVHARRLASVTPATIDTSSGRCRCSDWLPAPAAHAVTRSRHAVCATCGLTEITTRSDRSATSLFDVVVYTPSAAILPRFTSHGSATEMLPAATPCASSPPMIAPAMLPPPMKPSLAVRSGAGGAIVCVCVRVCRSGSIGWIGSIGRLAALSMGVLARASASALFVC